MTAEVHPLEPFLPVNARLLMLGSFPPARSRWSMEFYYPNLQNDMWRIVGLVFYGDKEHFLTPDRRHFDRGRIETFCRERGIALSDTAVEVVRQRDNASDRFLEVTVRRDIRGLIERLPECRAIVVTGQKAADTLALELGCALPKVGEGIAIECCGREMELYRMPSSSRAYPLALDRKAEFYESMFRRIGLLG